MSDQGQREETHCRSARTGASKLRRKEVQILADISVVEAQMYNISLHTPDNEVVQLTRRKNMLLIELEQVRNPVEYQQQAFKTRSLRAN